MYPAIAYEKCSAEKGAAAGEGTAHDKRLSVASIRKADLDKLARVTEQFLQQYLAANEALRDAERWDVGGQPFVAVLARRKNKRAGGGEDDGCARPSSSPAMSLRVCEREHNTQRVRSSIPAPKTSEFFFVEIHNVGPNKDTQLWPSYASRAKARRPGGAMHQPL